MINKHGFLLPMTLIVAVILFILSAAILSVSLGETILATRQHERTQAYYSAKSGAEIGLLKIEDLIDSGYYDDVGDLYSAVNSPFSGSVISGKDNYNVTFVNGGLVQEDKIKILSQAAKNNIEETTAVTINFRSPDYLPLDWLNPGQIMRAGFFERTYGPVVVKTAKLLGHAPKKSTVSLTTWRAPSIHFVDDDGGYSFEITAKRVVFQTNLLSFKKRILIKKDDDDSLNLSTFSASGFIHDNGSALLLNDIDLIPTGWGVIALKDDIYIGSSQSSAIFNFSKGYYAFLPGLEFSNKLYRDDPNYLKLITNADTIAFIDEVIRRETSLAFNPNSIYWSNK